MQILTMPRDGSQEAMLSRTRYIDNLLTTTFYDVRKKLFGDIFQITPLYDMLNEKNKIKERVPDGTHFEIPIRYGNLKQNQKWFGRGEVFGEKEAEFMTRLKYETRNLGDSITRFWDDERKNRGKARILNYVEEVIETHTESLADTLGKASWAVDRSDPMAMQGLPELISVTPAVGTVGGIDRSKNPYLRNQVKSFTGLTIDANLLDEMETMINNCSKWKSKGRKTPDIIITTQAIYERYKKLARALGVYEMNTADRRVNLGLGGCMYGSAQMFWDPDCVEGNMYFLNTDTIEFAYDPMFYMQMTEWKNKHNSLDRHAQVITVCQLLFNNFLKNGVIHSIPTT